MKHSVPRGDTYVWMTGGFLALCVIMITGMLLLIVVQGIGYFRPRPIDQFALQGDAEAETILGQVYSREDIPGDVAMTLGYDPAARPVRYLVRVGNRELFAQDFRWVNGPDVGMVTRPANAVCLERVEYGNAYGFVHSLRLGANRVIDSEIDAWDVFQKIHETLRGLLEQIKAREKDELGDLNYQFEQYRLEVKALEYRLANGRIDSASYETRKTEIVAAMANLEQSLRLHQAALDSMRRIAREPVLVLRALGSSGEDLVDIPVASIVRAYKPNSMTATATLRFYASKVWEFLSDDPREANAEGGVFPAIFGTVMMVLLMTMVAVPFGVLAALYLREYTSGGAMVRIVRIAVNNLAGVPSIVFGMFGLGFFVYFVGGGIDALLYPERLPAPTYGTGGILWASLTLSLLTVPVVIVATEEALAAIPRGIREGSLALGATKWETIRRVVLPSATPGIMTGAILAMARGAGEVAPLMITGVVKLATEMPFDSHFPFFHLDRKFMHLGFHIYDIGFQTSNVEANIGMVYTTTLLLIGIILFLNMAAIMVRARLRERYRTAGF